MRRMSYYRFHPTRPRDQKSVLLSKVERNERNHDKKYTATFRVKPHVRSEYVQRVPFGSWQNTEYIVHKKKSERSRYRLRRPLPDKPNPMCPEVLEYYLLWGNSTDLKRNIVIFRRKFQL